MIKQNKTQLTKQFKMFHDGKCQMIQQEIELNVFAQKLVGADLLKRASLLFFCFFVLGTRRNPVFDDPRQRGVAYSVRQCDT